MVATAAIAPLFPVSSPQPNSRGKTGGGIKGVPSSVDVHRIKTKSVNRGMQVKANAQALQRLVEREGDVVQVDTWVASSGKHGMHHDWLLRDSKADEILTRASRITIVDVAESLAPYNIYIAFNHCLVGLYTRSLEQVQLNSQDW
uniref:Acyl-ACP thioesterase n=1 Tax=Tanacetum cinerariifolium TaxID=118510 RepID=A0A699H7D2_TANCI|nr:acyl-ACP thioesterase [Tanacetum cinerariifolium]